MPYRDTTIRGEEFHHLDPADPDQRRLLIEGEHPEYHDTLADPHGDDEVDGVNPRRHLAMHELVANQLWDNDPPEAWHAAKRLREQGMDRHDILHALASVAIDRLHPALVRGEKIDIDDYRQALDNLGRDNSTYQLRVTLAWSEPPVWRRLSLPADTPLNLLHEVIQLAFGWEFSHLHQFEAAGRRFTDITFEPEPGDSDERQATLAEVAPHKGDGLRYTYDFGDDWVHDILVEDIAPAAEPGRVVCLAGERAGPPEDCGGIPGYQNLLDAMSDPDHPDRDHYLDWLGAPFDPAAVDLDAINAVLAKVTVR